MARPRRNRIPNHNPGKGLTRIAAVNALSSPDPRQQTGVGRVSNRVPAILPRHQMLSRFSQIFSIIDPKTM